MEGCPPTENGVSFLEGCLELDRYDITKHWRCVKCHQMLHCIVGKFHLNFFSHENLEITHGGGLPS